MAILKVAANQSVRIPDLLTESGAPFVGRVITNDGGLVAIEHDPNLKIRGGGQREGLMTMTWESESGGRTCPVLIRRVEPGRLLCQIVIDERRQSVRARCDVELYFSVVDPNDLSDFAERIMARVSPTGDQESNIDALFRSDVQDESLRAELAAIRSLIERLTHQVERLSQVVEERGQAVPGREMLALDVADCSATGLLFRHHSPLSVGTIIKMRITFKSPPRSSLECIGVIVRCDARANHARGGTQYELGVRFTHIHEADRECIVRQIFRVQRNHIRDRKLAGR
jgi:hypothetical protein